MRKKRTQKDFIDEAKLIHGNIYDYSEVKYLNQLTKVKIICSKHGEFLQYPKYHLQGNGCLRCGNIKSSLKRRNNTKYFIDKSINVHGEKYDYSKVDYTTSQTKVTIICPKHGEFEQIAQSHMSGHGCSKCSSSHPMNNKSFILYAKKIHQDRYDYSKVEYQNKRKKVILICKEHGEFLQTPNEHLAGSGCIDCAGLRKKTTKQFIEEAILKHGKKYDYSKSNYINSSTKITIVCPVHGEFEQVATHHLSGVGCKDCSFEQAGKNRLKGIDDFITDANKIHRNRYDYSNSIYNGTYKKIEIICEIHGSFKQTPKAHLIGQGCPECGLIKIGDSKRKSKYQFILEANKVHKGKYDYSLVSYKKGHEKVIIICPTHGQFFQAPIEHTSGKGCIDCTGLRKKTTEQFVEDARLIHGDRYDYSEVDYKNNRSILKIICSEHGVFEQQAKSHLKGRGCIICSGKKQKDTETFVEEANLVHKSIYDYSNVDYISNSEPVLIKCKTHGIFPQTPKEHLRGGGCPRCKNKKEGRLAIILNEMAIIHRQFRIENRFFDFYLPEHGILIERDGEQHYHGSNWEGIDRKESLNFQQKNDREKTKLAKSIGFKIYRIPYWLDEEEERIEVINILNNKPTYPDIPFIEHGQTHPKPKCNIIN